MEYNDQSKRNRSNMDSDLFFPITIWVKDEGGLDHTWRDSKREDKSGLILNIF